MAKSRGIDAKFARLRELRREPALADSQLDELRKCLADRSNLIVAESAEIVGSRILPQLASDLLAAFDRFMIDSAESDKMCRAKIAIVEALNNVEHDEEDVFLRAVRHKQPEFRWGAPEPEDVAAPLRASAAYGLVRINYRDVLLVLAELLADKDKRVRTAAARALGATGNPAALPLLRYKARIGDKEPEVIGDCLAALMAAEPKASLPFVAEFLDAGDDAICEAAAFALAESRRPDALGVLKAHWTKGRHRASAEALLLAISMTRLPEAIDFLCEILAGDDSRESLSALSALAIHKHNQSTYERVASVVRKKTIKALQDLFCKKFIKEA